ncbi:MAG: hypothetical protein M0Z61_02545 [Nitrospiraceae bacterium]|nr:hypothetical protein [Nitrospiraceae bacterium]
MPKKERPLPRPPRKKGRHGFTEQTETEGLVFDKLQQAMAEGRAEEFMKENLPEGEYARKLTDIMMGMSGVSFDVNQNITSGGPDKLEAKDKEADRPLAKVPKDVLQAAMEGNIGSLTDLLKREHEKSAPHPGKGKGKSGGLQAEEMKGLEEKNGSLLERDIMESLYEISVDNNLSIDWLLYRALKLYIKKYRETGQL